jgi:hypothetical protein
MRTSNGLKLLVILTTLAVAGCAAVEAQRQAEQQRAQQQIVHMDMAHIYVTTEDPASNKPFTVLGELTYTEPFSADAIDEGQIKERLKKMAYEKWPDEIDEICNENQQVSADGSQVTVTAKAIKFESSVDRSAMHKMNEGLVVSPTNQ